MDEKELIARCREGDMDAFEQLMSAYQQRIYNVAYRMMGNPHDASDLTQETMIRIYRFIGSFRGESAFSTWVYHITLNGCREALRRLSRHPVVSLDEPLQMDDGELLRELPDKAPLPEEHYLNQELSELLQTLIAELPPEYRAVLILRENEGLRYEEIAAETGISIGTVKSRLNRARARLREKLYLYQEQYPEISRLFDGKEVGE